MSAGTHKPAEALHQQIAEPQPEAMRLADECDESATHWVHEIDTRLKAAKMLRAQNASIAELEKDAARYRWLRRNIGVYRTNDGEGPVSMYLLMHKPAKDLIAEETDAAIDAALADQAKQDGAA